MPRCPNCGKSGFANHEATARHMGQPRSGCSTWSDNLIRLHEELLPVWPGVHFTQQDMVIDENAGNPQEFYNEEQGAMSDYHAQEGQDLPSIQHFPGAARTFQGGTTFLNHFDMDQFSNYQTSNIYYLYASHGEWEIASWLLQSSLSMSAINSLLSLDLVCVPL
jgi:hypothetical protein